MLPLGQQLALSSPWWSWDSAVVRRALWASVLGRLRKLGNERLKANGVASRSPSGWKELEFLRKEAKTHRRVFDGKTNLCLELLLGYASLLGIDASDCFPDTETWIAEATVYLSLFAGGREQAVCAESARIYVQQVVPLVSRGCRTTVELQHRIESMAEPVKAKLMSVVRAIAPALEENHPETKFQEGANIA